MGSFGHLIFTSLGVHLVTELGRDDDHVQQVLMAKIRGSLVTVDLGQFFYVSEPGSFVSSVKWGSCSLPFRVLKNTWG